MDEIELEKQQLSGNVIKNKIDRLNLSETFDLSRIRYDYGIKLKNDNVFGEEILGCPRKDIGESLIL